MPLRTVGLKGKRPVLEQFEGWLGIGVVHDLLPIQPGLNMRPAGSNTKSVPLSRLPDLVLRIAFV